MSCLLFLSRQDVNRDETQTQRDGHTGCYVRIGALVFEKVLSCETEVLSGETLFH